MRLVMVSVTGADDVRAWSGTPHFFMKELVRHGVSVEMIAPLSRWFKYLYSGASLWSNFRKTPIHFDRHPVALSSYSRQIQRRLKGMRFDAIVALSSVPVAALNVNRPIICWTDAVFECLVDYYPNNYMGLTRNERSVAHKQEQEAMDRSTLLIYSSDWAADVARREYHGIAEKVHVIEYGSNMNVGCDRVQVTALIEKRLANPINLLFVGVDWERKGGPIAFEVAKQLNDKGIPAVLTVVGCAGPDASFVKYERFISKATPEGEIELAKLFMEATFFLLPTRAEAAGIVFAEASSFGLPVLSTDTGGIGNYVLHGQTGFRFPLAAAPEEYVDAIIKTLHSPDTYRLLSLAAYDLYEQKLNWKAAVDHLLKLIGMLGPR